VQERVQQLSRPRPRLRDRVELGLRVGEARPRLRQRRLALALDQALADLVEQQEGRQRQHDRAQDQGADHHPRLQRHPPQLHQ
jgi:hypothetical protein